MHTTHSHHIPAVSLSSLPISSPPSTNMKLLSTTLAVLLMLLLTSSSLQAAMAGSVFCDTKCKARCAKASVYDRCLFNCGVCCRDCHCVPSGTYGNKDECPCYRDKLTSDKRKHKCP